MTPGKVFQNFKGDVAGGVQAALFTLPANIALGMIAFQALGPGHMGQGILAGMYASVFGGFLAALLGGSPGLVTCALAPTTLAFAAVLAGLVLGLALNLIDRWSLLLIPRLFTSGMKNKGYLLFDLVTVAAVTVTAVVFGVIMAVALGVAVSLAVFAARMSRSVIRRTLLGSTTHSMKKRNKTLMELLFTHGDKIAVLELEGALFFGNTDTLARKIDMLCRLKGVKYLILDMRRVSGVDCSAARVLGPTIHRFGEKGVVLAMGHVHPGVGLWNELQDTGFAEIFREEHLFQDIEMALEHFEDDLLQKLGASVSEETEIPFKAFLESEGLAGENLLELEEYFRPWEFASGETVFRQGDPGDSMYYLQKGAADVLLPLPDGQRSRKLQVLTSAPSSGRWGWWTAGPVGRILSPERPSPA